MTEIEERIAATLDRMEAKVRARGWRRRGENGEVLSERAARPVASPDTRHESPSWESALPPSDRASI